jgi:YHS domain-containing protein
MKLNKKILVLSLSLGLTSLIGLSLADDKAEKKAEGKEAPAPAALTADNATCPVSGKAIDATKVSSYSKVVAFCCGKCQANFNKDPGKHVDEVAKITAPDYVNTKCPVSGKDVDASKTAEHGGQTVAFCCGKCPKAFAKDPNKYESKIVADNAGNDKCPISGKAVDTEKYATYTKNVGFCCGKCQAKFDKDPDSIIAKVK